MQHGGFYVDGGGGAGRNEGSGSSSPPQHCDSGSRRSEVTPAFLRTLMPQGPSPEDQLYRKKQQEVYRIMELAARQNLYEAAFTVVDADIEDERMLDIVYDRLVRWLTRPRDPTNSFSVKPSSKALRSFVVSWDPLETPQSVVEAEARNPHSATYHRMKRYAHSQHAMRSAANNTAHLAPPHLYSSSFEDDGGMWSPWLAQVPFEQSAWSQYASAARGTGNKNGSNNSTVAESVAARASASRAAHYANATAGAQPRRTERRGQGAGGAGGSRGGGDGTDSEGTASSDSSRMAQQQQQLVQPAEMDGEQFFQ